MINKGLLIIPTYNEKNLLQRCLDSLMDNDSVFNLDILIVNAGEPLSEFKKIIELKVADDQMWGNCIARGIEYFLQNWSAYEYVMFANADTYFLKGSLDLLIKTIQLNPNQIVACPGYAMSESLEKDDLTLVYSNYQLKGGPFYIYERERMWAKRSDAPLEDFEVPFIAGGQGVIFHKGLLNKIKLDESRFPHYCADVDFWLSAYEKGYKFRVVSQAGIVKLRPLGIKANSQDAKFKWRHIFLKRSPYWWRPHWNLRKKRQNFIVACFTTFIVLSVLYLTKWLWGTNYRILDRKGYEIG